MEEMNRGTGILLNEMYYRLVLEDRAAPSCCQASKVYYGSSKEIEEILLTMRKKTSGRQRYAGLLDAYERYQSGNQLATHMVAGQQVPVLTPLTMVDRKEQHWEAPYWEYVNAQGICYPMRCRKLDATHIWLEGQGGYSRCVRVVFEGLEYRDANGAWVSVYGNIKGNRYMVVANRSLCINKLAVEEKRFADRTRMIYDINSFDLYRDINLAGLCDDIVGRSGRDEAYMMQEKAVLLQQLNA